MSPDRQCGDCQACCFWNEAPEIEKKAAMPCPKICSTGCSIHGDRPQSCRAYHCAWKMGLLPMDMGPLVTNLVVELQLLTPLPGTPPRRVWVLRETEPNAASSIGGSTLIELLRLTGIADETGNAIPGNVPIVLVRDGLSASDGTLIHEGSLTDALTPVPAGDVN
jgi:hypothetical protein